MLALARKNWYKFLNRALSSLLNDMLQYQYIVIAFKVTIYNNMLAFVYKRQKCI